MNMLYHTLGAIIVFKDGTILENDFGIDNEEPAILSNEAGLFLDMTTIDDFQQHFFSAFKAKNSAYSTEEVMKNLSNIDYFEDMLDDIADQEVENIKEIIIWTDQQCDDCRKYCWQCFSLNPYHTSSGSYQTTQADNIDIETPSALDYIRENVLQIQDAAIPPKKQYPIAALTFEEFGVDFEYQIREEDLHFGAAVIRRGVTICSYKGTQKKLEIPPAVEDYPVVLIKSLGANDYVEEVVFDRDNIAITDDALKNCTKIATFDENGYKIVSGVLLECKEIRSTMVLSGARKIGYQVFMENATIEHIVIDEGTEEIDNDAFRKCPRLQSVQFPSSLKRIGPHAFEGCHLLRDVVFPEGLEYIDWAAFCNCVSIQSVSLPNNLKEVGWEAFKDCRMLYKVEIGPDTICKSEAFSIRNSRLINRYGFTVINGVLYDFDYERYRYHYRDTQDQINIFIPPEVTTISGNGCFYACNTVYDTFVITDKVRDINPGDFSLAGIKKFQIVNHLTDELIFETTAFAKCPNMVNSSYRFLKMCDLIEAGDFKTLQKKFGCKIAPGTVVQRPQSFSQARQQRVDILTAMAERRTAWLQKIEKVREKGEQIQFSGKLFVFTGFGEEKNHPLVQQVIARGGELRSRVSGLTNYLVINPEGAGETKMEAALEQKKKGSNIKFLMLEELEQALKCD